MGLCCSQQQQLIKIENQIIIHHSYNHCQINLVTGDILEQTTNAIVAQTDLSLSMNSKLSRRIKRLAGKELISQLQFYGSVQFGDIIPIPLDNITKLLSDYLILAILPHKQVECNLKSHETPPQICSQCIPEHSEKQFVFKTIYSILQQCQKLRLSSLSLPVLHAENVRGSQDITPYLMLLAIKLYLEEHAIIQTIEIIKIIIKDKALLPNFKWAFQKIFMPETSIQNQNHLDLDQNNSQHNTLQEQSRNNEKLSNFGKSYQSNSLSRQQQKNDSF